MRDPGSPSILIDASNVCRDASLRPRDEPTSWARLTDLVRGLEESDIGFSEVYVVADRSLRRHLAEEGQQALRRLERAGQAEQTRFADERLVDLAYGSGSKFFGGLIASHDFFDDFRRRYPELDNGKAVGWAGDESGTPYPRLRDLGERSHVQMSRKEEEGELADRRLRRRDVQARAAGNYFKCISSSCLIAQLWPDRLEELPRYSESDDTFRCPRCGDQLEVGAARAAAVQVIVFAGETEVCRVFVEEGHAVDLGRLDAKGCVGFERYIAEDESSEVSRRHVRVEVRGERASITDLDSKNGSAIGPRQSAPDARVALRAGDKTAWPLRDAIFLPGGIRLERSGRRLPISGERPASDSDTYPTGPATTLSKGEDLRR